MKIQIETIHVVITAGIIIVPIIFMMAKSSISKRISKRIQKRKTKREKDRLLHIEEQKKKEKEAQEEQKKKEKEAQEEQKKKEKEAQQEKLKIEDAFRKSGKWASLYQAIDIIPTYITRQQIIQKFIEDHITIPLHPLVARHILRKIMVTPDANSWYNNDERDRVNKVSELLTDSVLAYIDIDQPEF